MQHGRTSPILPALTPLSVPIREATGTGKYMVLYVSQATRPYADYHMHQSVFRHELQKLLVEEVNVAESTCQVLRVPVFCLGSDLQISAHNIAVEHA
jgi:hypothetical protein